MIVTSPRSAPRSRLPRRVLAGVAALALGTGLLLPVAASATTPAPSPTPDASPAPGALSFTLSPVGNGVVRPGDGLTVSVTLDNATATPTTAAEVALSIGAEPLDDRAALTAWLGGDVKGVGLDPAGATVIEAVQPAADESRGILLAADSPLLAGRAPGVYPLLATYASPDGPLSATSAMTVPADGAPVSIGVVVPITATPAAEGLLTSVELAELTAPGGDLTSQLDAVEGSAAILAVDPAIPAAIRVLGTAAPQTAADWLLRLENLPNTRFALQFGDADAAVQLDAGLPVPQSPSSLMAYMRPADFAPGTTTPPPTPTSAPTASPSGEPVDPTLPVYPDLATLLDIGDARSGVYWPAVPTASSTAIAALGAIASDDGASTTLVSSRSTAAGADGGTVAARGATGDAEVLVYDADVSRELTQASLLDDGALRGASLTAATAYLSFAAAEVDGGSLLVALDRASDRSRVGLRTAVTSALGAPGVTPVGIDELLTAVPIPVEIGDVAVDEAAVASASALFADESELSRFATVLDDPTLLTAPERAEILQLLGVAAMTETAWGTAVAEHRAQTRTTLDAVRLVPSPPINLLGTGAGLWFTVRNDLPYPANLVLLATPDDLRLDVQRASPFSATAASNTRVEVPVASRVGRGDVGLTLQLRSSTGIAIGGTQSAQVNVRAEWETVGLVALGVIVGGLLVVGVVRTVRRVRARSRAARQGGADATHGDDREDDR